MLGSCPGSARIKTPELEILKCPRCGEGVEIFSDEILTPCPACGTPVSSERQFCVDWCPQARQCLGVAWESYSETRERRRA
jgi:hypothetical protein